MSEASSKTIETPSETLEPGCFHLSLFGKPPLTWKTQSARQRAQVEEDDKEKGIKSLCLGCVLFVPCDVDGNLSETLQGIFMANRQHNMTCIFIVYVILL